MMPGEVTRCWGCCCALCVAASAACADLAGGLLACPSRDNGRSGAHTRRAEAAWL